MFERREKNPEQSDSHYSDAYRLIVESVRDYAIFMLDLEGNVKTWNEGARRAKGYEAEEIIGRHFSCFYPVEDRPTKPATLLEEARRLGRVEDIGWRVRKDGSVFWADVVITAVLDSDSEVIGFAKVTRDLTKQRDTEEALILAHKSVEKQAQKFDIALSSSPDFYYLIDTDHRFTYVNRSLLQLWGKTLEEVIGKNFSDLGYPEELVQLHTRQLTEAFQGKIVRGENPFTSGEGNIGYYEYSFTPIVDNDGRVITVSGTTRDVTAHRELLNVRIEEETRKLKLSEAQLREKALENERENFRNLFMQTPEMVCILKGPEHVFEFVNEAHIRALGFDATGKAVREAQPESVEIHGILDDVYRTGVSAELREIPITVGDRLRHFNLTYSARRDFTGKINGVMILGVEVTEELRVREELKQAKQEAESAKEKMAFLAEASSMFARSLDLNETLSALGALVVPDFADWYGVELLNERGVLDTIHATHVDPAKIFLALEMRKKYPSDPQADQGPYQVIRTGEPDVFNNIPEDVYLNSATDAQHREMLRALSISSAVTIPLKVRERIIGVMNLCQSESHRIFSDSDIALMTDFASRASLAIENARLFSQVQEDSAKLNVAIGAAKLGVFDWQAKTNSLYWSGRTKEIYEWDEAEPLTGIETYLERLHEDHKSSIEQTIQNAIANKIDYEFEHKFICKDKSFRWVQCNGHPYYDRGGTLLGISGTVKDITWKKEAEQNLAKVHQLQKIAALLAPKLEPEAIAKTIIDEGLKVIDASAGSLSLLNGDRIKIIYATGYSPTQIKKWDDYSIEENVPVADSIRDRSIMALMKPDEIKARYPRMVSEFDFTKRLGIIISPIVTGDQAYGAISVSFESIVDFTPALKSYIETLCAHAAQAIERAENFKAAKEAKRNAEEASKAKSAFLANMSHEIRTPMNSILGFSKLLRTPDLTDDEKEQYLSRVESNGDQLLHLIDDILDLSRVEAGEMKVSIDTFSINDLLKEVYDSLNVLIKNKRVKTQLEIANDLPRLIISDYVRIKQVLMNLISNSAKFTDAGIIAIRANKGPGDSEIRIQVEDSGIGISESLQQQLFHPFSQGDVSVTRKYGGTGLGLVLSRRISEALNGSLNLLRSEIGIGTLFEMTIPMVQPENRVTAQDRKADQPNPISLEGLRLLLAEDSPDNRTLFSIYLKQTGVELTMVEDGVEAVEAAQKTPFDLILMDIQMPRLDGLRATKEIRKFGYHGPIVALTAHALEEEIKKSFDWGCDSHLTKPISRPDLLAEITRLAPKKNRLRH